MTHIVAGYPSIEECEQIACTMIDAGVSYLEVQIPFSDPVADGTTIMAANQSALENGTQVEDCFELMKRLKERTDIPLLFMSYFNILHHYGVDAFCQKAKEVGCYGLIVPDIPYDEEAHEHYVELCRKHDLHAVQVISPITPERRLAEIGKVASGMVYCVTRTGTTGARQALDEDTIAYLDTARKYISVPLSLGFGISSQEQVKAALSKADIAVVGSAIIKAYDEASGNKLDVLHSFVSSLMR